MNQYPNYYNNYLPVYGNYQPQIQNMVSNLPGKVVGSHEEIMANDVPMNGNIAYFPTRDMNTIYAKSWNANGQIVTATYVRSQNEHKQTLNSDVDNVSNKETESILDRFDVLQRDIEERFSKMEQMLTPKKRSGNEQ